MDICSAPQFESYLAAYGWRFRSAGENRWRSGWQGADRYFGLEIDLDSHWITFVVRPLIHTSIDWSRAPTLLQRLLELNGQTQMASLYIDEQGYIALRAQALRAGFDYDGLSNILGILGYYADLLSQELSRRVRDMRFREVEAPSLLT